MVLQASRIKSQSSHELGKPCASAHVGMPPGTPARPRPTSSHQKPRRQPGTLLGLTRGRKPRVMEAIGMLVMPEFFTYRNLQRVTGDCTPVAIPQRRCTAWGSTDAWRISVEAKY